MVYRCLITLFSTWSDFNWQRETAFFFASNRWIQGSATKRHAYFSRAWHRKGCMKLNGEMDFEGSEIPLCPPFAKGEIVSKRLPLLEVCPEHSRRERLGEICVPRRVRRLNRWLCVLMALGLALLVGCRQKMADQPRYGPLARSTFFEDGRAARPLEEGT